MFCFKKKKKRSKNAKNQSFNTTAIPSNIENLKNANTNTFIPSSFESEFEKLNFNERLKFCADEENIKNSKHENDQSSDTTTFISSSFEPELEKMNLTEERLKRYVDEANLSSSDTLIADTENGMNTNLKSKVIFLREKAISEKLNQIKLSMEVDLCFVLDCTSSMEPYIAAAKDSIIQVSEYVKYVIPNIKLRVGFCGYRDHCDGNERIQIFNFTDSYKTFKTYISENVPAFGGGDAPEDVLGGLNAAITQMNWHNTTRIIFHIGDYPPHGHLYQNYPDNSDSYSGGDPYGLTANIVLEKLKSQNILYFFGRITVFTEKMLEIFRSIIGEFPVFDLVGGNPIELVNKFIKATSSSITLAVSLTSTIGSESKDLYSLKQKKLEMDSNEPDWNDLPSEQGVIMWYFIPETLGTVKNQYYFHKSNLFSKKFTFKKASNPFSAGAEKYAYFALDTDGNPGKNMVIKEYHPKSILRR